MLPPEVAQQFSAAYLDGFDEPALWPPEASQGYRTRIRFSLAGIALTKLSIRLEERGDGRLSGRLIVVSRTNEGRSRDRRVTRFQVTREQMDGLQQSIERAGLWTIHPQIYGFMDDGMICVDGMEMMFERVDANGYRFANANAQCAAPRAVLRVAEDMLEIADATHLRRLLY